MPATMTNFFMAQSAIQLALADAFKACAEIMATTGEPSDAASSEVEDAMRPFSGTHPYILDMFETAQSRFSDDVRERIVQHSALYPLAMEAMRLIVLSNSAQAAM